MATDASELVLKLVACVCVSRWVNADEIVGSFDVGYSVCMDWCVNAAAGS